MLVQLLLKVIGYVYFVQEEVMYSGAVLVILYSEVKVHSVGTGLVAAIDVMLSHLTVSLASVYVDHSLT